jgi:uncharacterized coiled-coil protein SlyX
MGAVGTIIVAAFSLGVFLKSINGNIDQMKTSIGEIKTSMDKQQSLIYELNGTMKGQSERLNAQRENLKSINEQLKAVQVSVRETPARIADETSDKASERIAGMLEKRLGKNIVDLAGKVDAIDRRIEETSSSLVLWLTLTSADKAVAISETSLTYELRIPMQDSMTQAKQKAMRGATAGAVNFFVGDKPWVTPVVGATAQPTRGDKVPIHIFFRDKSSRDEFGRLLSQIYGNRMFVRLKVTFDVDLGRLLPPPVP